MKSIVRTAGLTIAARTVILAGIGALIAMGIP